MASRFSSELSARSRFTPLLSALLVGAILVAGAAWLLPGGGVAPVSRDPASAQVGEWLVLTGRQDGERDVASSPFLLWEGELDVLVEEVAVSEGRAQAEAALAAATLAPTDLLRPWPDGDGWGLMLCRLRVRNASAAPFAATQTGKEAFNVSFVCPDGVGDVACFDGRDPAMDPARGEALYFTLALGEEQALLVGWFVPLGEAERPGFLSVADLYRIDLADCYGKESR